MAFVIESGDLNAYKASVNENGRLLTDASLLTRLNDASRKGDAYSITSDFVALSTLGPAHGIIHVQNTDPRPLHIAQVRTSGVPVQLWTLIKNPTAGTLITGGTNVVPENLFFGTTKTSKGVVAVGVDGSTVTDGVGIWHWINSSGESTNMDGSIIITTGTSIALTCIVSAVGAVAATLLAFHEDI